MRWLCKIEKSGIFNFYNRGLFTKLIMNRFQCIHVLFLINQDPKWDAEIMLLLYLFCLCFFHNGRGYYHNPLNCSLDDFDNIHADRDPI